MKPSAMILAAALGLAAAGTATAEGQEALAKSAGCLNCHATAAKKVGPAFKDVAAKYKGKADAEASLVAKLAEGKTHPAVKASAEDQKAIVKWILSM